jgi:hypothetical protein
MVGENLLNRIKQGYSLQIKQGRSMGVPKEYNAATGRYLEARLGSNGELFDYVAGLPFPDVHFSDPQIGLKMAWNFYWRWLGDDYKTGGGTGRGKIIRYAIEKRWIGTPCGCPPSYHQDSRASYPEFKTCA